MIAPPAPIPTASHRALTDAVLDERAARCAERRRPDGARTQRHTMLVMALGMERFGLSIEAVREVVPVHSLTRVWQAPDAVLSLMNVRGEIITVLDLARLLGLASVEAERPGMALVLRQGAALIAVAVTRVLDVRSMPTRDAMQSDDRGGADGCAVHGVTEDGIGLLRTESILEACRVPVLSP